MTATLADSPSAKDPVTSRAPFRLAVLMVASTVVLITLGGMVTSTGSGLAFDDWPLANGSLWPEDMTLGGFFEHVHRAAGALVGLLILTLTIWVGVRQKHRTGLRRLMIFALGLVVLQGVIGGVGVLEKLPYVTSVTHGVLAQLTLCTLTLVAFALSPAWNPQTVVAGGRERGARKAVTVALSLIILQVILGAIARHSGNGLSLWGHVTFAFVVFLTTLVAAGYCAGRIGDVPGVSRASRWVMVALLLQVALGFVALLVRTGKHPENIEYLWRASLITSHVLVGALLSMAVAMLAFRAFRNAVPEPGGVT